jgi:hypothetical protein
MTISLSDAPSVARRSGNACEAVHGWRWITAEACGNRKEAARTARAVEFGRWEREPHCIVQWLDAVCAGVSGIA